MNDVIFWNLPQSLVYTPGAVLPLVIILSNPETRERQYSVKMRMSRNGWVFFEDDLEVDGQKTFTLPGGGSLIFYETFSVDSADVLLELVALDALTGEYQDSVAVSFLSPATGQTLTYLPSIAAIGAVGAMVSGLMGQ